MSRLVAALTVAASCVLVAMASAAPSKRAPETAPLDPGAAIWRWAAPSVEGSTLCNLGETGSVYSVNYIQPPDDAYYTLLRPSLCPACPGALGGITGKVHALLDFREVCIQQIEVSIVGAMGDTSCRVPDPQNVICLPSVHVVAVPSPGIYDLALTLPSECRFAVDAFLRVEFASLAPACSSFASRPRLLVSGQCQPCRSYNIYPAGNDDLCSVQLPGNPTMYVEVDSCLYESSDVTPTARPGAPTLVGVVPNPGPGLELDVWFTLAKPEPARLELFDLLGHLVDSREVGMLGAGPHRFRIARSVALRPGVYVVRLVQGGRAVTRKATVIR